MPLGSVTRSRERGAWHRGSPPTSSCSRGIRWRRPRSPDRGWWRRGVTGAVSSVWTAMRDVATIFAQLLDARLRRMGAGDPEVLDAMAAVPRHRFVPRSIGMLAYLDRAQPIGEGQTISQPSMVATMLTVARLVPNDRVMEIGVGSGYVAAVLARLAAEIYAVERVATLAVRARRILDELGVRNVTIVEGDGSLGLPEQAPFDAILV